MATLPDKLIVEFAEALGDKTKEQKRDSFVYGTVSSSDSNGVTVTFDGAEIATPVSTTVDVNVDDRVLMLIKNHTATVVSNITSPSINGVTFTNFRDGVLASFDGITAKYADLGGFVSVANDTGCDSKTSDNGGHRYKTSLYKHSTDGTYEYETGMKGDSTGQDPSQNLAFYVRQIPYGATWAEANVTSNFYVRNNGYLYAKNAKIKGEIEATAFKATSTVTDVLGNHTLTMLLDAGQLTFRDTAYPGYGVNISGYNLGSWASTNHYAQLSNGDVWTKNGDGSGLFKGNYLEVSFSDGEYNRVGRFVASASGNVGLYDSDNSNYIVYSDSSFNVRVPHKFYSLGQKDGDTTQRIPIGSSNVANQKVSWIGCTAANTVSVHAQWDSSTWATKTLTTSSSDVRLKRDISDTKVNALDVISRIPMREFTWKEDDVKQKLGMIADELEKIDPLFVVGGGEDEDGNPIYKSINVLYLLGYCVKAIQELKGDRDDGR